MRELGSLLRAAPDCARSGDGRGARRVLRGIVLADVALGGVLQVVALLARQEFAAWRVALAVAGFGAALLRPWSARRRGTAPADLARLGAFVAVTTFAWAGLLEAWLLLTPLVARDLLLVFGGACANLLLLVAADSIGGAPSAAQRVAGRGGFAIASVVLCACAVEWIVTWRLPAQIYDVVPDDPRMGAMLVAHPRRGFTLRPGFRGRCVHPEFPGLRVEINALGMRDRPDEGVLPAADAAVVLVLGDSLVFGTGVKLEETFQERLEARAAELTPRPLRVYGAGVPGYGQFDALDQLEEIGASFHPDVVVEALYEGNDLGDNWRSRSPPGPRRAPAATTGATLLREAWRHAGELAYWRGSSSALQYLWPALEKPLVALGLVAESFPTNRVLQAMLQREPPPWLLQMGVLTLDGLRRLRAQSGALGAAFVVLVIPATLQADPPQFDEYVRESAAGAAGDYDRTLFHRRLVDALRADGFSVVDPLAALESARREGRGGYYSEGHWNALGHRIAAEALFAPVKQALAN